MLCTGREGWWTCPTAYLAGRPTSLSEGPEPPRFGIPAERYRSLSASFLRDVLPTYRRDPVALILGSANRAYAAWVAATPRTNVAPGVAVVRGPPAPPGAQAPVAGPRPAGPMALLTLGVGALAILALIGSGWSVALLGPLLRPIELGALAPAVGAAIGVLGGVFLNAVGIPLSGWGASLTIGLLTGTGWAAARVVPSLRSSRQARLARGT